MFKIIVVVTSLLGLFHSGLGQVVSAGQCDLTIPVVQDFQAENYLNTWFLIESYPSNFQLGSCIDATYTPGENDTVSVFNTQIINQTLDTITGSAVVTGNGTGTLLVTFPTAPAPSEYWILDTDYSSYALVYSCVNLDLATRQIWSWKLSRTRSLTTAANNAITQIINSVSSLNNNLYEPIDHSAASCFYFPEPQPGVPVTFPGSCETFDVVPNFNLTQFAGTWYEVEAYPDVNQQGDCVTHEYTVGNNNLNLQSMRMVNQTQIVTTGTLSFASSFETGGRFILSQQLSNGAIMQIPFWIVATDYEDYALAYSCQFAAGDSRAVFSWKFSRNPTLSESARQAIATATANIAVIDDRYFEPVAQGNEACFFLPDLAPGAPVILPGQCDPNIPVVQNFDAGEYLGNWRLIETYPSEFQSGACNQANYYPNEDGSVLVINTQVVNEFEESMTGRAVLATTDGSAKLLVTFPNSTQPSDYWVLDTDYESYALVYSCRNIDTTQRRVYAWKLSRDRVLSATAQNNINQVMNGIDVLDARYFQQISHSNDACFHYPDFDPLPDVIELPGPCPDISGQANFNLTAYQGRWIQVETYPQQGEAGVCVRAVYSEGANDLTLNAVNTRVAGRSLVSFNAVVELVSSDGSGRFDLTVNIGGMTFLSDMTIIATDYDSFSLAYSCTNLTNGNRQVTSLKLSRTTSLTAQANAAIATVIASTQGLNQNYYEPVVQTEEACFYLPEPNPAQPLLLRGTCPNLTGQANFEIERYLGWWHHLNNYPTGQPEATCHSSRYTQAGNVIQFEDTHVIGLTGVVTRGTVEASSNGLLRKTWNNGLNNQDIWVLATDYSTYSLVFSCEPYDDEYVRVWSSIQTQGQSLTAAAEQAIDEVIATNNFLDRSLFLTVNQSEDSCFHYPETDGRVVLRGQCDDNIPVQQNFDISGYSGTWYQIQRYPYPEVSASSTCIGTRYTHEDASGVVTVLNWEVLNGELNTMQGQATVTAGAVLDTVFTPNDQETRARLHILATDYTGYSLAYTCENLNAFERVVVAFKLSRTRSLTPEANTAINAVMATRQELNQDFFVTVPHPDGCEEPNSGFLFRSSLIVILICYAINLLM